MKRLIPTIAIILGWAVAASAATPGTLTSLRAIRSITNEQASQALPVAFEATVTYFREYAHFLIVQDGDMAVFIRANTNARLIPGDQSWCEEPPDRASVPMCSPATSLCSTMATCPNLCLSPMKR